MKFNKLWAFPTPSGGHIKNAQLIHKQTDVLLVFDFYGDFEFYGEDGKEYNGGFLFKSIQAYKNATEMFYMELGEAYDKLVEYPDSEWLKELSAKSPKEAHLLNMKHYAIYIEDYGLYEIIAADCNIFEITPGPLKK